MSRETSEKVATDAGRVLGCDAKHFRKWLRDNPAEFETTMKSVAASALAQHEEDPGPLLEKRPAAFLVGKGPAPDMGLVFIGEDRAKAEAERLDTDYEGLYRRAALPRRKRKAPAEFDPDEKR